MPRINMSVMKREGRKFWECQWADPVTGKLRTRSTKATTRRDAERFAAKLTNDLEEGMVVDPDRMLWLDVHTKYQAEVLAGLAVKTVEKAMATIRAIDRIINPKLLTALDARQLSQFGKALRDEGRRSYTIKGHLAEIMKLLRWAKRQGYLVTLPIVAPPPATGVKGRAITTEEFERMLKATDVLMGAAAESWKFFQRGLWLSGLRIAESLVLRWDDETDLSIDTSGEMPLLRIQAGSEKGRQHRVMPITPDFGEFLLAVPEDQRTGFVFNPSPRKPPFDVRLEEKTIGKLISQIGREAGVKTATYPPKKGATDPTVKWASAHDFRRAFGFRWAQRVMPIFLQQLMRHESIQTTMQFYVGRQAEAAAAALWKGSTNIFTNTQEPSTEPIHFGDVENS